MGQMVGTAGQTLWQWPRAAFGGMVRIVNVQPASPWLPVIVYGSVAAAALLWNALWAQPALWAYLVLPLTGWLLWTFLEYVIHSGAFHRPTRSSYLLTLQASHGGHHEEPTAPDRIIAQFTTSLPVAVVVFGALSLLLWSASLAALAMVGVIAGYLSYEVVHYRIHLGRKSRWLPRALVRHHLYHHYKDQTRCFGVTTRFWDWVFGTSRPARRRRLA